MILALDPSLSATALVRGDQNAHEPPVVFGSENKGDGPHARIKRYRGLVGRIMGWVREREYDAVFIEGYAYDSTGRGIYLAEFGGMLRAALADLCPTLWEITPSTLKRFATGNGNANKALMMGRVQTRWNVKIATHDECDAFALYRLGLMVLGHAEPMDLAQAEVLERLKNRTGKKPRTRTGSRRRVPPEKTLF